MGEAENAEIFAAIRQGDAARVAEMVAVTPEWVAAPGPNSLTPLMFAIYFRQPEIIEILREAGAEVDIFAAAALGNEARLASCLEADPALLYAASSDGWTPLHLAAHFDQPETVSQLLDAGADIEARSTNALTNCPLHAALSGRALRAAKVLLERGASPSPRDAGGFTPLHQAGQAGHADLVTLLLNAGAEIDARSAGEQTPLELALLNHRWETAALLESWGAKS